jgi:hypothetical protein
LNFAAKLGPWAVGELRLHQAARDYETVLELTYQSSVAHWWVLQPDLQLIFRPGVRIEVPFPAPVERPIPNALY